jgi:hypothetical protein
MLFVAFYISARKVRDGFFSARKCFQTTTSIPHDAQWQWGHSGAIGSEKHGLNWNSVFMSQLL